VSKLFKLNEIVQKKGVSELVKELLKPTVEQCLHRQQIAKQSDTKQSRVKVDYSALLRVALLVRQKNFIRQNNFLLRQKNFLLNLRFFLLLRIGLANYFLSWKSN